jgi:hypothetical protein
VFGVVTALAGVALAYSYGNIVLFNKTSLEFQRRFITKHKNLSGAKLQKIIADTTDSEAVYWAFFQNNLTFLVSAASLHFYVLTALPADYQYVASSLLAAAITYYVSVSFIPNNN